MKWILLLLLLIGCSPTTYNIKDISVYDLERPARKFPLDILVSNEFSSKQEEAIFAALNDWQTSSDNIVSYNVVFDWYPPKEFCEHDYVDLYPITVWKKRWDDPCLFYLQMNSSFVANGFGKGNFIILVDRGDLNYNLTYIIFKHEFGHILGMEHIKPRYPALMNLGANRGIFTEFDKLMFCKIYECK